MATIYKSGVKTLELSKLEAKAKGSKQPAGVDVKAPKAASSKSGNKKSQGK